MTPPRTIPLPARDAVSDDSESETFDLVLGLAGEALDRLFVSKYYLRPIAEFRAEVIGALSVEADKLLELCQTTSAPRVSFETAQPKTL